jgi:phosphoglycerate dehydrogenase-like enzyme
VADGAATARVLVVTSDADDAPPGLTQETSPLPWTAAWGADGVAAALPDTEIVFLWTMRSPAFDALRDLWPSAARLRWVHSCSAGVERLLFPELVESDVVLTNSRGVYDLPMAEYALALMLSAAKGLPDTLARQRDHDWRFRYTETLAGKRLVVVGPGSIGRMVARYAAALGMRASAVGRSARGADEQFDAVVGPDGLRDALSEADYVVVTVPLTDESRGMIDGPAIAAMKPTGRLINLARGAVVDEDALVDALRGGRIAGAGLDVFAEEPLDPASPLWDMPNVIVSPHISGDTDTSEQDVVDLFLDNLRRRLAGEPLRNVVDKRLGFVTGP